MNEKISNIRNFLVAAMLEAGVTPTIIAAVVVAVILGVGGYMAWNGVTDAWVNYQQEKELTVARAEKAKADADRAQADQRAALAEGAINVLEQEKTKLQTDYVTVYTRYQELRKVSDEARTEYERAKNAGLVINGGKDLPRRFRDLSRLLDDLDADTHAKPKP